jgi:putative hydrolase of the HAD superfamily
LPHIKNIIFDLGGVLININYHKTINAFKALGIANFDEMYSQITANELFESLEVGNITEEEFYESIKKTAPTSLTNNQIQTAWNAILLDFRSESITYLKSLSTNYNLYLLSNTNSIHQTAFNSIFANEFDGEHINDCFIKTYYSHQINLRKPYKKIYDFVLNDANLNPHETLFIDDSKINIPAANELGIHTHLLLPNETIEGILPTLLKINY